MINRFTQVILAAAVALSTPYAFATKKRADEAGGGAAAGGSGGPKGGMDSAASRQGAKRLSDRITGEMVKEHTNPSKPKPKEAKQGGSK